MERAEDVQLLFASKQEFDSPLDIYKFIMRKTLDITIDIPTPFLELYSEVLRDAILHSVSGLRIVDTSGIQILRQQVPNELERILKEHRERKFSFTKTAVKNRYTAFKKQEIWDGGVVWHTVDEMEADIKEWVSDYGHGFDAVSKFRQGRNDAVGDSVAEQISGRIRPLLPCLLYGDRYIPKETLYVDDGEFVTYSVAPIHLKLLAHRPLSVTSDHIEIIMSTIYIWEDNGKILMSSAKRKPDASVFLYPTFCIHGHLTIKFIADVMSTVTKAVNTRKWLKALTLGIAHLFKSEKTKEFHATVKLQAVCTQNIVSLRTSQAVSVTKQQAVKFIRKHENLETLIRENEMEINGGNNETNTSDSSSANGSGHTDHNNYNAESECLQEDSDEINALIESDEYHRISHRMKWQRLKKVAKDLGIALPRRVLTGGLTKGWDEVMQIVATKFSSKASGMLTKATTPAGVVFIALQITGKISKYVKGEMTNQMLKRSVSQLLIADNVMAVGGSMLIATLVGGPIGFAAGLGFGCIIAILDHLFGDKIAKLFIKDNQDEHAAWQKNHIAQETAATLKAAYEVFDLTEHASDGEVKEAYRLAILKYHPDKSQYTDRDVFIALKLAYDVIIKHRRAEPIIVPYRSGKPLSISD